MNLLDGAVELLDCDETLTVVRQGRVADADIRYVDGVPTAMHPPETFPIVATVQPMGGKDLLMVPEAFREKESLWLWQRYEEALSGGRAVDVGDVVLRDSRAYQVQSSEDWGSYAHCILTGVDVGPYQAPISEDELLALYPETPSPEGLE